jgi:multiple antibiotic resistance protein
MPHEILSIANAVLFTVATLLPIVNPLGTAPIFLALTADLPVDVRHRVAAVVGRHAFLLLTAAMLVGSFVLRIFGVSLPVVRVAGGLLVTAAGWRLLNDPGPATAPDTKPADTWEREAKARAFYPLTFPLTVGPGSISVAITLGARAQGPGGWGSPDVIANLVGVALIASISCSRSSSPFAADVPPLDGRACFAPWHFYCSAYVDEPHGSTEADVTNDDAVRIGTASAIGAIVGGLVGYALLTERGRDTMRGLAPAIDGMRDELVSLARSLESARGSARDGLQWFNELLADTGDGAGGVH